MKQLMVVICFSVVCLVFSASAAEDPAGLSGTWIQDMKASDAAPRPITNLNAPTNAEGGMGGGFGGGMGGGMGGGFPGGMGGGLPGGMGGGLPGSKQGQPAPEPGLLVLQQRESEMQIKNIAKGVGGAADTSVVESYKLDGKEVVEMVPIPNSPKPLKQTTKVSLKKNKLQVKKTIAAPQGDQEIKRDYSLSKDGKQLTLEIKTTTGMGLTVMQMEQKLIYNRQ
jgi:hypothetical protein